jgi:uncharacterized RDD family membrane protein YckC/DNA-binding transcriptional ArsR family regulator
MAVDQERVSKILSVLSHPLRREILQLLAENEECSFTELTNSLGVDTAKLSFHLRSLSAFLEQTSTGKYTLSKIGHNAIVLIRDLESWAAQADLAVKTSLSIASLKKRVYASMIDLAIAFGLFLVLPNVFSSITSLSAFFQYNNIILFLILFWFYLTLLEGFSGQTLGKRVLQLKVMRVDGKRLFYDAAAVRNFGKAFLLPLDLLIGFRLRDRKFIRYFDKFSGTTVIDMRP